MPRIAELVTYPVKSCAGVSLDAVALTSTGLAFDRTFCVANARDGKFISQRSHPRLALVSCAIEPPTAYIDRSIRKFTLICGSASMARELRVEVDLDDASGTTTTCECWEWRGRCADAGADAASWFTEFLNQDDSGAGERYELVRWIGKGGFPSAAQDDADVDVDDDATRLTSMDYGSRRCTTTLSDGFPMLLVNKASVDALDRIVKEESPETTVDGRRFRGNVVVDDAKPWTEDSWSLVRLAGDIDAELCKPCSRCSIPAVDPDTGSMTSGAALVRVLSRLRSGAALGTANRFWRASPFFGWNIICSAPQNASKILRVGDDVSVLETRRAFP